MSKLSRHAAIRDVIAAREVSSQEELRRALFRRGHRVTQATLSRDIHELGLVKTAEGYKVPQGEEAEIHLPSIERLIQEFVYDVKTAQNLVVVKTSPGSAQPVSAAMDAEEWDEVVGTIGGDDTILAIAPEREARRENWRNVSVAILHKNEYSHTTRGLRGHRLFRIRISAPAFPARRREEAVAAPAQRRERRIQRSERDYPQLSGNGGFPFETFSWQRMKKAGVDVVFFATPHEFSRELVPEAIGHGFRVIDLSGAWRLKQAANREVYGFAESASQLDDAAVYGLPELHADAIRQAALLANPGCYSTSIILALAPWIRAGFVDLQHGIICDSKSGVSGAGKQPTSTTHFVEVDGDFSAYNVFGHRHTGEMLEQLGLENSSLQFTPHLLPIPRGILSTIYVKLAKPATAEELEQLAA